MNESLSFEEFPNSTSFLQNMVTAFRMQTEFT